MKGQFAERCYSSCQQRDGNTPCLCLQAEQGGNPSQLQWFVGWQPCSSSSPSTTVSHLENFRWKCFCFHLFPGFGGEPGPSG